MLGENRPSHCSGHRPFLPEFLEGADLSNANLTGAELANTYLLGANLRGARLVPRSRIGNLILNGANVQGAEIDLDSPTLLSRIVDTTDNWILANRRKTDIVGDVVDFPDTLLTMGLPGDHRDRLIDKDLTRYDFNKFKSYHMQHADLKGWILHDCNFANVDLESADLSHSDLRDTRFDNADLTNVNFEGADLRGADLSNAQGLTQWQLNSAITGKSDITGKKTQFPQGLHGQAER
jgi:uncharacterized protein YjbI with pentapeptide repeats